ncbi:MAG TPA: helix-turn-helix domain-containing protein [Baekduia sp.]|nr:helix-turn-helix domain-containing protein [Baekduia sp.]
MSPETATSTVDRILDATLRQLELHGMRRTTMDDIAQAAGLSRPTLYEYFANKDAIYTATVDRELTRFIGTLGEYGSQAETTADRLVAITTQGLIALQNHKLLQRLLQTEQEVLVSLLTADAPGLQVGYEWVARQLAIVDGEEREPQLEHRRLAEMLVRVVHSLVLSPQTVLDLSTPGATERWAREWLVPWLAHIDSA